MHTLPREIFKPYDIRGAFGKTLTVENVEAIGHAIGSEARARGLATIAIGRDGRLSGQGLAQALAQGLQKSGVNVVDVGKVATPMLCFAAHTLCAYSGVMVTGSHNPPEYNGLKMVLGGETLAAESIQALRLRLENGDLAHGKGNYSKHEIGEEYFQRIVGDVKLTRPMKIIVDCGNGVAGRFAPTLYRKLGCEVTELFCEVNGAFPNHHPDPSVPEDRKSVV